MPQTVDDELRAWSGEGVKWLGVWDGKASTSYRALGSAFRVQHHGALFHRLAEVEDCCASICTTVAD